MEGSQNGVRNCSVGRSSAHPVAGGRADLPPPSGERNGGVGAWRGNGRVNRQPQQLHHCQVMILFPFVGCSDSKGGDGLQVCPVRKFKKRDTNWYAVFRILPRRCCNTPVTPFGDGCMTTHAGEYREDRTRRTVSNYSALDALQWARERERESTSVAQERGSCPCQVCYVGRGLPAGMRRTPLIPGLSPRAGLSLMNNRHSPTVLCFHGWGCPASPRHLPPSTRRYTSSH